MILPVAACLPLTFAVAQTVPPRPLEQWEPSAPENRAGDTIEGWVVLRYSVLADGSTSDISVVDRTPPLLPYGPAVSAVENWTFEPATQDGATIDWHSNESVIVYRSHRAQLSPLFFRAYHGTQNYIEEDKLDWARRNNQRTLMRATRLEVMGPVLIQAVIINLRLGDMHAAYDALVRATDPRVSLLEPEGLAIALKYRNFMEIQFGDRIAALQTLARRRALAPVPQDDPVLMRAEALELALNDGSTIGHYAKIIDAVWRKPLSRQIFAITDVVGEIETLRAECDRRIADLEYVPGSEWTLPESWGNCAVAIEGRDNTEFRLFEFQ
jgi:hypothetical protein